MEQDILEKSNQLDIGPMGFGGKTTVLGVKIGYLGRLPASYFVSRELHVLGEPARRRAHRGRPEEVHMADPEPALR